MSSGRWVMLLTPVRRGERGGTGSGGTGDARSGCPGVGNQELGVGVRSGERELGGKQGNEGKFPKKRRGFGGFGVGGEGV